MITFVLFIAQFRISIIKNHQPLDLDESPKSIVKLIFFSRWANSYTNTSHFNAVNLWQKQHGEINRIKSNEMTAFNVQNIFHSLLYCTCPFYMPRT